MRLPYLFEQQMTIGSQSKLGTDLQRSSWVGHEGLQCGLRELVLATVPSPLLSPEFLPGLNCC